MCLHCGENFELFETDGAPVKRSHDLGFFEKIFSGCGVGTMCLDEEGTVAGVDAEANSKSTIGHRRKGNRAQSGLEVANHRGLQSI